jgi:hypothetical protein
VKAARTAQVDQKETLEKKKVEEEASLTPAQQFDCIAIALSGKHNLPNRHSLDPTFTST